MLCTHRAHDQTTDSRRLAVLITPGYHGGRGQVLSTVDDDRRMLITLSVQLYVLHDGRLGVAASRGP